MDRMISLKYYDLDTFLETSMNGNELYEYITDDIKKLNNMCANNNYNDAHEFYQKIKEFEQIFILDDKYKEYLSKCEPEYNNSNCINSCKNMYSTDREWFKEIILSYTQWLVKYKQDCHIRQILKKILTGYMSTKLVMIHDPTTYYANVNNIVLDFIRYYKLEGKIEDDDLKKYNIDGDFIEKHMSNLYKVMDGKNMLDFESLYLFDRIVIEQHKNYEGNYVVDKKKLIGLLNC